MIIYYHMKYMKANTSHQLTWCTTTILETEWNGIIREIEIPREPYQRRPGIKGLLDIYGGIV